MQSLNIKKIIAVVILLAAVVVFGVTLVHATLYAPEAEGPVPAGAPLFVATSTAPARLIIPALSINANVQQVGLNTQGAIRVPNNFTDVAWYKYGPVPGQVGSAIIDGHVDNGLGLDGVFKHLGDIKTGDDVYVQEQDGSRLRFVVTDVQSYPYQAVPMAAIVGQRDTARLDLITCEGAWVANGKTYDHRLVIYTKLAGA